MATGQPKPDAGGWILWSLRELCTPGSCWIQRSSARQFESVNSTVRYRSDDLSQVIRVSSLFPGARVTNRGWWTVASGAFALLAVQLSGTAQFYQLANAMFALLTCALVLASVGRKGLALKCVGAAVRLARSAGRPF